MFRAYFSHLFPRARLKEEDIIGIRHLEGLTPADFAVVFESLQGSSVQSLRPGELANSLKKEIKLRRQNGTAIGFR
ncbi:MAG: hypothetical protein KDK37_16210, partial [Leptospiraceae bacterium]|nr:hypothetical protein [Leptospiraceae bacterium]